MYLMPAEVEATMAVIQRRSAPESRLIVAYHSPALMLRLVGLLARRVGEPLRSSFRADEMGALLARHGFRVVQDDALPAIAARLSAEMSRATRIMKHLRIAIADRVADSR